MDFKSALNKVAKAARPYMMMEGSDEPDIRSDTLPDSLRDFVRTCGGSNNPMYLSKGPRYWNNTEPPPCPNLSYGQYLSWITAYREAKRCPSNQAEFIEALEYNGINLESLDRPPYSNGGVCLTWEFVPQLNPVAGGFSPCPLNSVPACRCCCYNKVGGIWRKASRGAQTIGLCGNGGMPGPMIGD